MKSGQRALQPKSHAWVTLDPGAPAPLVYQLLKAISGVTASVPLPMPQREGQFHRAAGCSFATV